MQKIKKGIYVHTKTGKKYDMLGLASNQDNHAESDEPLVVYRACYDIPELSDTFDLQPLFVRPLSEFLEEVTIDSKTAPRFQFISQN